MSSFWKALRNAGKEFSADKAPRLAAALSYYTVFALAPMLVILIGVLGLVFGRGDARERLVAQLQQRLGQDVAQLIETMISNTAQQGTGVWATVVGAVVLLVAATNLFVQLQGALNEVWEVRPDPRKGFMHMLGNRLMALLLLLVLGLLLLATFVLQAGLSLVTGALGTSLPGGEVIWYLLGLVINLAILTVVFLLIMRVLPDAEVPWRDAWIGGLFSAVLFLIGQAAIGLYLGTAGVSSGFGAAGSLVLLLLWVYFSAQILLFGAEFTKAYSRLRGRGVVPEPGAVRQS